MGNWSTIWSTSASQLPRTQRICCFFALSSSITCFGSYSSGRSLRGPWYKRSPRSSRRSACSRLYAFNSCLQKKLEDKFHEVKEYLEEHPGASVEQTATDNDISTKQIRQWVREERLILSTATEAGIVCEKCGKPIRTGRFCERCKERMANEFQNAYQKPEPKMENLRSTRDRDRMRYLKNE